MNPIGDYHGKTYQNIFAQQPGVAGVITLNGVAPQTPPNQALAGTSTAQNSTITTAQGTASFALSSFYYGCGVKTVQAVAAVATACNITVTGYQSTSSTAKPVVSQRFNFTPVSPCSFSQASLPFAVRVAATTPVPWLLIMKSGTKSQG